MIELGKIQNLEILRITSSGAFLNEQKHEGDYAEDVLLPGKQIPEEAQVGDRIDVFIYKDSEDRVIATTKVPQILLGQVKRLSILDTNFVGAFLDWGLAKDLLLPFKEQTIRVKRGESHLVALYIDSTDRLCATMDLSPYLERSNPGFKVGDKVSCTVYKIVKKVGAFVAIQDSYLGLVPTLEVTHGLKIGDQVVGRIARIQEDGKVDITLREKIGLQMELDAEKIYNKLQKSDGFLPLNDKSNPEDILKLFGMSKQAFKRAVGKLFKERKIEITAIGIRLTEKK